MRLPAAWRHLSLRAWHSTKKVKHRSGTILGGLLLASLLQGCTAVNYYSQLIDGHFDLMGRAEPIDKVAAREGSTPELREALKMAVSVRDFASSELALPDNKSYRTYADLERDQVVWMVVATPEFSIEPHRSCFLMVGCLSYRGYFARQNAETFEAEMRSQGMDTYIGRSLAYSTLGWFDDPLLNTIVKRGEVRMVEVIFHELAHQQLYINGDTTFNESFATAVAQIGARRWFELRGEEKLRAYLQLEARELAFNRLLIKRRESLGELYRKPLPLEVMRSEKAKQFAQLQLDYRELMAGLGGGHEYDHWMAQPLNNAHLALNATYQEHVPAFVRLFEEYGRQFADFYRAAEKLGSLPQKERDKQIAALLERATLQEQLVHRMH